MQKDLQEIISLVKKTSKKVLEIYQTRPKAYQKEDKSLVTEADFASQKIILEGLNRNMVNLIKKFNKPFRFFRYLNKAFVTFYFSLFRKVPKNKIPLRESDRVFIFGSGYSINNITQEQWAHIAKYDTFSFNWFMEGEFVPIKYHLTAEIHGSVMNAKAVMKGIFTLKHYQQFTRFFDLLKNNKFYKNTHIFLGKNYSSSALGIIHRLIDFSKITLYKAQYKKILGENFNEIYHGNATLFAAVNAAYLLGYKEIVLVGIDLYDSRYFWLDRNKTDEYTSLKKNITCNDMHRSTLNVLRDIPKIRDYLKKRGISLKVWNPKSLLNEPLEVYKIYDS